MFDLQRKGKLADDRNEAADVGHNGLALPRLWPWERADDADVLVQGVSAPSGDVLMDTCRRCGAELIEDKCSGCGFAEGFCQCGSSS